MLWVKTLNIFTSWRVSPHSCDWCMVLFRSKSPAGRVLPLPVVKHLEHRVYAWGLGAWARMSVSVCLQTWRPGWTRVHRNIFTPTARTLKNIQVNHCKLYLLTKQAIIGHTVCLYYSKCWNTRIKDKEFMVFWKLQPGKEVIGGRAMSSQIIIINAGNSIIPHPGKERFRANSTEQASLLLGLDECIHQVAKVGKVILDWEENTERHRVIKKHEVWGNFTSLWTPAVQGAWAPAEPVCILVILGLHKGKTEYTQSLVIVVLRF